MTIGGGRESSGTFGSEYATEYATGFSHRVGGVRQLPDDTPNDESIPEWGVEAGLLLGIRPT